MVQVVLRPENLPEHLRILANDLEVEDSIQKQFQDAYEQNSFPNTVLKP